MSSTTLISDLALFSLKKWFEIEVGSRLRLVHNFISLKKKLKTAEALIPQWSRLDWIPQHWLEQWNMYNFTVIQVKKKSSYLNFIDFLKQTLIFCSCIKWRKQIAVQTIFGKSMCVCQRSKSNNYFSRREMDKLKNNKN